MPSVHPAAGQSTPRCQPRVEHAHELREHRISAARPAPGAAASPAREQGLRPAVRRHDRVARRRRHLHGCDCLAGLPAVQFADRTVGRRHRVVGPDSPLRAARRDHVRPVRSTEDHARSPCRPRVCRRADGSALGRGRPRALARDRDRCRVRGRRSVLRAGVRCDRAGHRSGKPARSGELVESGDRARSGCGSRARRSAASRSRWSVSGQAFLLDAATFAVAAGSLLLMSGRFVPDLGGDVDRSARRELGEAFRFVRARPWLWGTLLSAAVGLLAFVGPVEVLVPFVVKNELGGGRGRSGLRLCGRRLRRSPRRGPDGPPGPSAKSTSSFCT